MSASVFCPPGRGDVERRWSVGAAVAGKSAEREARRLLCIATAAAISASIALLRSSSCSVSTGRLVSVESLGCTKCLGTSLPSEMI